MQIPVLQISVAREKEEEEKRENVDYTK